MLVRGVRGGELNIFVTPLQGGANFFRGVPTIINPQTYKQRADIWHTYCYNIFSRVFRTPCLIIRGVPNFGVVWSSVGCFIPPDFDLPLFTPLETAPAGITFLWIIFFSSILIIKLSFTKLQENFIRLCDYGFHLLIFSVTKIIEH